MLLLDRFEFSANFFNSLVPTDGNELPIYFFQGLLQAIRIVDEVAHFQSLDTGVALTRNMLLVRLDSNNSVISSAYHKTALRFANPTDGLPVFQHSQCIYTPCLV